MFNSIKYSDLNSRQKENFNFHKVAAELADYGFNCLRLTDDWQGADFLACHIDGEQVLKIQLKGRLTFDTKYNGKKIYVAFRQDKTWYLYPHDPLQKYILGKGLMKDSKSWIENGSYSWPKIPIHLLNTMKKYEI